MEGKGMEGRSFHSSRKFGLVPRRKLLLPLSLPPSLPSLVTASPLFETRVVVPTGTLLPLRVAYFTRHLHTHRKGRSQIRRFVMQSARLISFPPPPPQGKENLFRPPLPSSSSLLQTGDK